MYAPFQITVDAGSNYVPLVRRTDGLRLESFEAGNAAAR